MNLSIDMVPQSLLSHRHAKAVSCGFVRQNLTPDNFLGLSRRLRKLSGVLPNKSFSFLTTNKISAPNKRQISGIIIIPRKVSEVKLRQTLICEIHENGNQLNKDDANTCSILITNSIGSLK